MAWANDMCCYGYNVYYPNLSFEQLIMALGVWGFKLSVFVKFLLTVRVRRFDRPYIRSDVPEVGGQTGSGVAVRLAKSGGLASRFENMEFRKSL